jgi:hypothetical protein
VDDRQRDVVAEHPALAPEHALEPHGRDLSPAEGGVGHDRVADLEPPSQPLRVVGRHLIVGDVGPHLEQVDARVARARAGSGDHERRWRLPGEQRHGERREPQAAAHHGRRDAAGDRDYGAGAEDGRPAQAGYRGVGVKPPFP